MNGRVFLIVLTVALIGAGAARRVYGQVIGQPSRLSDRDVERVIRRVENQANTFRKSLDAALDRSRLDGTRREDDINAFLKAFDEQTKRLHDRFEDRRSVAADVEAVLDRASSIDGFMRRQRLNNRAQKDWSALRASLDDLAQAYNVTWRWGGYAPMGAPVGMPTGGAPYRLSDREIEQMLHRIEQQSGRFRSSLDTALDRSRLDSTRREDEINSFIKEFDQEIKRLHDRFDERKSVAADVQIVLDRAVRIDDFMRRQRLRGQAQRDWSNLRMNLDDLARAYNVTWRWPY